jgi:hypothetical protein
MTPEREKEIVCKGSWAFDSACGKCIRCREAVKGILDERDQLREDLTLALQQIQMCLIYDPLIDCYKLKNRHKLMKEALSKIRGEKQCKRSDCKEAEIDRLRAKKDNAYFERNKCVTLIAKMALALGFKAGIAQHDPDDKDWEDDWRTVIYIDLPSGQVSWHFHDSHIHLLDGLPIYDGSWDGHSTEIKYERVLSPGVLHSKELDQLRLLIKSITLSSEKMKEALARDDEMEKR